MLAGPREPLTQFVEATVSVSWVAIIDDRIVVDVDGNGFVGKRALTSFAVDSVSIWNGRR